MKARSTLLVALLLAVTVLSGSAAGTGAATPTILQGLPVGDSFRVGLGASTALRVMTIGDSINTGLGSMDGCGYRTQLKADLIAAGVTPIFTGVLNGTGVLDCKIPYGHHGAVLASLQANVAGWIAADNPDVVLIQIGTNDATGTAPNFQARYLTLLATILTASPTVKVAASYMPYAVTSWAGNQPSLNVQIILSTLDAMAAYPSRVALVNASKLPCRFRADGIHPDYYDPIGRWYYEGVASLFGLPPTPANSLFYQDQPMPGIHRPATSCPA